MSAPAGWYPQEDGRQRYWDGTEWTEHFAEGAPAQPAASTPAAGSTAYGAPAYGQPTPAYATPPSGSSGLGKGCLIAGIIGLVVVALVIVAGFFFIKRAAEDVKAGMDRVATAGPTGNPFGSDAPDGQPIEGVSADIGKGFTVGDISVADGWTIEKQDVIDFWVINAATTGPLAKDTILDVAARNGSTEIDTTMCTGSKGATKLTCLPFTEDVSGATSIMVAPTF